LGGGVKSRGTVSVPNFKCEREKQTYAVPYNALVL
jgi:hypothetical protein